MTNIKWKTNLYDTKHSFVSGFGEDLVSLLAPSKKERILDLGCGTGHLTAKIAKFGAQVIGMDSSPEMIAAAQQNYPEIEFEVKEAINFNYKEPFDAIFSNAVLHWVKNQDEAIKCMYNNLITGGRLVCEFGGKGNTKIMCDALKVVLHQLNLKNRENFQIPWYFPSIGEYCNLLEKYGFETKYAVHFERPTELVSEDGIKDWFRMFGEKMLDGLSENEIEVVLTHTQNIVTEDLFKNGKWFADYKRIRIIALKH